MDKHQSDKEKQLLNHLKGVVNSHHEEISKKLEKLEEAAGNQADKQHVLIDGQRQQREMLEAHYQHYQNMHSATHEEIKKGFAFD